jgi:hypothetical protein
VPFGFAGAGAGGGGVGLNPAGSEPLVEPLGCGGGGGGVLACCACCCILARYSFSYASSWSFLDLSLALDADSAGFVPAGSVPFGFAGGGGGGAVVCAEPVAVDVIPYPPKYLVLGWYASFSRVAKYLLDGCVYPVTFAFCRFQSDVGTLADFTCLLAKYRFPAGE